MFHLRVLASSICIICLLSTALARGSFPEVVDSGEEDIEISRELEVLRSQILELDRKIGDGRSQMVKGELRRDDRRIMMEMTEGWREERRELTTRLANLLMEIFLEEGKSKNPLPADPEELIAVIEELEDEIASTLRRISESSTSESRKLALAVGGAIGGMALVLKSLSFLNRMKKVALYSISGITSLISGIFLANSASQDREEEGVYRKHLDDLQERLAEMKALLEQSEARELIPRG